VAFDFEPGRQIRYVLSAQEQTVHSLEKIHYSEW
jgi:hypothetical protein